MSSFFWFDCYDVKKHGCEMSYRNIHGWIKRLRRISGGEALLLVSWKIKKKIIVKMINVNLFDRFNSFHQKVIRNK